MISLKQLILEQRPGTNSCKQWANTGTSYWNGENGRPKITIDVSDTGLTLRYVGKGTGYVIATKTTERDSIHQAWNVVSCATNNYIKTGGLKPDITNISATCTTSNGIYDLTIEIPFIPVDSSLIYQITRTGGWNHGGNTAILPKKAPNLEGPVTHVTRFGGGYIKEHWVIYTISGDITSNNTPEVDKKSIDVIQKEKQRLTKDKKSTSSITIKPTQKPLKSTATLKNKK